MKEKDPKQVQIEGLQAKAEQFFANKAWDQANALCQQILAINDKSVAANVIRGRVLLGKEDFAAAVTEFDAGLELPGRDEYALVSRADAFAFRSRALYEQGMFLKAINSAYLGTLEKSDHIGCHFNRARAYIARAEYDKSINSLNRVIQIDPKNSEAYSLRGHVYTSETELRPIDRGSKESHRTRWEKRSCLRTQRGGTLGQKRPRESSKKDLEAAFRIDPNLPEALCDRAVVFAANKDYVRANADLDAALNVNPRNAQAHFIRSKIFKVQGNNAGALKSLDLAIAAGEDPNVYCERGNLQLELKEEEKALSDFSRAIELNPKWWLPTKVDTRPTRSSVMLSKCKKT